MTKQPFDITAFLTVYWQKKPCVIRNFFEAFEDPLDEHDLAGLAQESEVDSRVISQNKGTWTVTSGPIDDFAEVCNGQYTLLVQGVDRFIQELNKLSEAFSFIPNWRMDDVMVSYSVEGAGVGPHIDQYDVFIVQGKGSRRWQVGLPDSKLRNISPHPKLKQVSNFTSVIDEILQAGDLIYIPPGHPHNGVALEPALNYSVGFRAPLNIELLNGVLDESEHLLSVAKRYSDKALIDYRKPAKKQEKTESFDEMSSAQISENELNRLIESMQSLLSSEQAKNNIMQFLSRQHLPDFRPETPYLVDEIGHMCEQNMTICLSPGIRPVYRAVRFSPGLFDFFIDGEHYQIEQSIEQHIQKLLDTKTLTWHEINLQFITEEQRFALLGIFTEMTNNGHIEFV